MQAASLSHHHIEDRSSTSLTVEGEGRRPPPALPPTSMGLEEEPPMLANTTTTAATPETWSPVPPSRARVAVRPGPDRAQPSSAATGLRRPPRSSLHQGGPSTRPPRADHLAELCRCCPDGQLPRREKRVGVSSTVAFVVGSTASSAASSDGGEEGWERGGEAS